MYIKFRYVVLGVLFLAGAFWYLGKKTAQYCTAAYEQRRNESVQSARSSEGAVFFSEMPQGTFPGLKLRETDFLVPLNRLMFTGYAEIDDPKDDYGTAGLPGNVMVFRIAEDGDVHSFVLFGVQERTAGESGELKYLGKNIVIEKAECGDDGAFQVIYKSDDGRNKTNNRCSLEASNVGIGSGPKPDFGIAVRLTMNKRAQMTDKINP